MEKSKTDGPALYTRLTLGDSDPGANSLGLQEQLSASHVCRWMSALHLAVKQEAEFLSIYRTAFSVELGPVDGREAPSLGCTFEKRGRALGKGSGQAFLLPSSESRYRCPWPPSPVRSNFYAVAFVRGTLSELAAGPGLLKCVSFGWQRNWT